MSKEENKKIKNSDIIDDKMMEEWLSSPEYRETRFFKGMANLRGWLIFGIVINIIFSYLLLANAGETDYLAKLSIIGLSMNLFIFILFIAMYYSTFAFELFVLRKNKKE